MRFKRISGKKIGLIIAGFLLLLFFCYWLKVQLGINLLSSYGLSPWFPFHYLADRTIYSPEVGTVFFEDFEGMNLVKKWQDISPINGTTVSREKSSTVSNPTTCLVVQNTNDTTWVYSYIRMIETCPGDVYYYEGLANIKGDDAAAFLNIGAFDEQRKAVDWNFYRKKADRMNQWTKVQNTITISDPRIRFITFRLVGTGKGEFRFDDILLKKRSGPKQTADG